MLCKWALSNVSERPDIEESRSAERLCASVQCKSAFLGDADRGGIVGRSDGDHSHGPKRFFPPRERRVKRRRRVAFAGRGTIEHPAEFGETIEVRPAPAFAFVEAQHAD